MKVLVDYDNVSPALTRQGPRYVADRILGAIAPTVGNACTSLHIRMYGGWDEKGSLTTRAQKLNADLLISFPRITRSTHTIPPLPVRLSAALAQSLECLPKKSLRNTLRSVAVEKQLSCHDPAKSVCRNLKCPISTTAHFLTSGNCPSEGCNITPAMLVKSVEQKLVDSMMVADLIHLAEQNEPIVVLVSSDDDLWPGIIMAMQKQTHVVHVHTKGVIAQSDYRADVPGKYTQLGL
jgi:uncharacterized LabA/DUF88 family protein